MTRSDRLDNGLKLIAESSWEEGLSLLWDEVDEGNEEARLELGWLFDANGLHSFSMDQWLYLADNSSDEDVINAAIQNAASNLMWMRDYSGALALVDGKSALMDFHEEVQSRRDSDVYSDVGAFAATVSQLLISEAQLLAALETHFSRGTQVELCRVRDALASATSYFEYSATQAHKSVDVEVPVMGSASVSRIAEQAMTESTQAWWNCADAASRLIADYADEWEQAPTDETFQEACKIGSTALAQAFLSQGDHSISEDQRRVAVQNVGAGLLNLGSIAGFVYSGLV